MSRASSILTSSESRLATRSLRRLLRRSGLPPDLDIREHPRSGRNRLFLVTAEERTWLAKAAPTTTESWFYRQIGPNVHWTPGSTQVADAAVVVTDYLDRCPSLFDVSGDDPVAAIETLVALAPLLAELHQWPVDDETPEARPALPQLDPVHVSAWVNGNTASRHVLRSLQRREQLCQSLRRTLSGAGPRGVIHGDLKTDNVLRSPEGPLLIDWELAGHGAVAWDLGSVLGSILAIWIDGVNLEGSGPDDWFGDVRVPYAEVCDAVRRFMTAYQRAVPPDVVPGLPTIVDAFASWLVVRSWAEATFIRQVNPRHLLRLVLAEGIVRNPHAILRQAA